MTGLSRYRRDSDSPNEQFDAVAVDSNFCRETMLCVISVSLQKYNILTSYRSFFIIGEGTLPWAIFRSRIFSNYFSQKFKKRKITIWKSDNLTVYGNFCLDLY